MLNTHSMDLDVALPVEFISLLIFAVFEEYESSTRYESLFVTPVSFALEFERVLLRLASRDTAIMSEVRLSFDEPEPSV